MQILLLWAVRRVLRRARTGLPAEWSGYDIHTVIEMPISDSLTTVTTTINTRLNGLIFSNGSTPPNMFLEQYCLQQVPEFLQLLANVVFL